MLFAWGFLGLISEAQAAEGGAEASVTTFGYRGIHRLAVPVTDAPELTFAGSLGYGVTEPNGAQEEVHHRLLGIIGIGAAPLPWLGLGINFEGRYDIYSDDEKESDWNVVGEPRMYMRGGGKIGPWFQLGADVVVWFPGATAPSFVWEATTLDARLLATLAPRGKDWFVAAVAGYRWDNSAAAAPDDWDSMAARDRISLGLSEFDAVLLGLGAAYSISKFEIFGEFTADLLVGEDAPTNTSNLRVTLGTRYRVMRALKLEFLIDTSVGKRPGVSSDDPLVPVEPRISFAFGVSYGLGLGKKAKDSPPEPQPAPPPPPAVAPAPSVTPYATLRGQVTTVDNVPLAAAKVRLTKGETVLEVETDEAGGYMFEQVPLGQAVITVVADDYEPQEWTVQVVPEMPILEPRALEMAIPGSQLRGLVRSFDGKPLQARVTILPVGIELNTEQNGFFQVDLEPGRYTVVIEASGFRAQQKKMEIEPQSVSILNVDLHRNKR